MRWYHWALVGVLAYGLAGVYLTTALLELWSHPLKFWRDFKRSRRNPNEFLLSLFHFGFGVTITPLVFIAASIFRFCDRIKETSDRRRWKPRRISYPR